MTGPAPPRGTKAEILGGVLGIFVMLVAASPVSGQRALEKVASLRFEGNHAFSDRVLGASIVTRATECLAVLLTPLCWAGSSFAVEPHFFAPRELERDRVRLRLHYYRHGYREAVIESALDRAAGGVHITFRINEGRPVLIDSLAYQGLDTATDLAILDDFPVLEGAPLDQGALATARDSLTLRLRNAGYAHAEVLLDVLIPAAERYRARVNFEVFKGPSVRFGPISVEGNEKVGEDVVLGMLPFREGSDYNAERILEAQRNLYGMEVFSNVVVTEERSPGDSVIPISVQVGEGDLHRFRTGVGWSTADCLNVEASWTSRNFAGGGRRFQLLGRMANLLNPFLESTLCRDAGTGPYGEPNWVLSAQLSQPRLLSLQNTFAANVFWERQSLPDLFVRQSLGVDFSVTREGTPGRSRTLFYQPATSSLDAADIFFCSSVLVCDPEGIEILQASNWLAPIGIRFLHETSGRNFGLDSGHYLSADIEHASRLTGSDFTYNRLIAEASSFREFLEGWFVAARVRGGWLRAGSFGALSRTGTDIAHPQKRFYSGGATSVRGFAHNQLGPRVLVVAVETLLGACAAEEIMSRSCDAGALADDSFTSNPTGGRRLLEGNAELRFPLSSRDWQGSVFLDFGQVWAEDAASALEWTPGLGVRYFSAIGPLRFDVAYRFRGGGEYRVLTSGIRPFDPASDHSGDRLAGAADFVRSGQLEIMHPTVLFGEAGTWSLRRFQLHISLGQIF